MNIFGLKIAFKMPKKYDLLIHISVIALVLFGTLMITSTSVGETLKNSSVVFKTFVKQFAFVFVSYFGMVLVANNFTMARGKWWSRPIGYLVVGMMFACLFFDPVNGSQAWIRIPLPVIGEVTLQPSEFMKTVMILLMAVTVESTRSHPRYSWSTIVKIPFGFFVVSALLILLQHDSGSLMILTLLCAFCFLIPTHPSLRKLQHYLMILIVIGGIAAIFLLTPAGIKLVEKIPFIQDYQLSRFVIANDPFSDPYGDGYQLINSLYAFATGGWKGLGLGQSVQKMMYLPEATSDYILPIIVEELGIFGFCYILFFYVAIIYRLFYYAFKSKSEGEKIIFVGTSLYIFIHFVFNVGGVSGLIPLTGVPLLFISQGSSSLLSICAALGMCQAIIAKMRSN